MPQNLYAANKEESLEIRINIPMDCPVISLILKLDLRKKYF